MRGRETTPLRGESRRVARCVGALGALAAAAAWTAGAVERAVPAAAPAARAERVLGVADPAPAEAASLQPVTSVTLPIATGQPVRPASPPSVDGPLPASLSDGAPGIDGGSPLPAVAVNLEALTLARRPRLREALAARLLHHVQELRSDATGGSD